MAKSDNTFDNLLHFLKSQRNLEPSEILMKDRNRMKWISNNARIAANKDNKFSEQEVNLANENLQLLGQGFKPKHQIRADLDAAPMQALREKENGLKEGAQTVKQIETPISTKMPKKVKRIDQSKQQLTSDKNKPPDDYHEMLKQVLNNPDIQESHAHDEWHKLSSAEQGQVHQALNQWRQQKPKL